MTSTVEKTAKGTIYKPGEVYDVPKVDLLTLLFGKPLTSHASTRLTNRQDTEYSRAKDDTILHASAENPSWFFTKSQGRTLTRQTAHMLRSTFGVGANGPGKDIVTVISTGNYLIPLTFYGVIAAGGVFSAASAASTASELARLVKGAGSKCLICNEATKEVALKAAAEVGLPMDRVCVISEGADYSIRRIGSEQNLITSQELEWERITDEEKLRKSLIVLIYSSGTTGLPKGVCLSHTNIASETFLVLEPLKKRIRERKETLDYRTVGHLPIAHIAGIQGYFINPFYMGGPVYWMPKFSFPEFLAYFKKYKVTHFFTVPPIYLLIAKHPLVTDQFDSVEYAVSGAAPLGKELQHAASQKLGKGKVWISQTWGLSETTGSATVMRYGDRDETGSVSSLVANVYAR